MVAVVPGPVVRPVGEGAAVLAVLHVVIVDGGPGVGRGRPTDGQAVQRLRP